MPIFRSKVIAICRTFREIFTPLLFNVIHFNSHEMISLQHCVAHERSAYRNLCLLYLEIRMKDHIVLRPLCSNKQNVVAEKIQPIIFSRDHF